MKIAVISDTHNRLPPSLLPELELADEIWHLGDVCHDHILFELEQLGKPLYHVRGNCDSDMTWPLTRTLERDGLRFLLVHIPPATVPSGCAVVLHGHTHVPRDETVATVRFLNPGCISRPNRGAPASYAWLDLDQGRMRWQVVVLPTNRP
jgi:uncharacterized protein